MLGRLIPVIVVFALFLPHTSRATWPLNGQPICTATDFQDRPQVVADGASGAIMVWADARAAGNYAIYAQRVDALGVPLWTPDGVAVTTPNNDADPQLVSDGAGGAIIAWSRNNNNDIYAQRINATGAKLWTPNGVVISSANGSQQRPVIASDNAGGAFIAWQDGRGLVDWDIYAQRVNALGVPQWQTNGSAVCTEIRNQTDPRITADGLGGAVITWTDLRPLGTVSDIYAQRVNAASNILWPVAGVAVCTAANDQMDLSIVADGTGGAIVAWTDNRNLNWDVFAQRISSQGTPQWAANGVALAALANNQAFPVLLADGLGGAFVAWEDRRNAGVPDIYVQRLNTAGTAQWVANGVALGTVGYALLPDIVTDGLGGAIVAWMDVRSGTSDIYARRINGSGVPQWTPNGVALSVAPNSQFGPALASDGVGGAFAVFTDDRAATPFTDVYAQRIERNGYWGYPAPEIAGVRDIPGDQGGQINLAWDASRLDAWPDELIDNYTLWRAIDETTAATLFAAGATRVRDGAEVLPSAGRDVVRVQELNGVTYYWKLMSTLAAFGLSGYSDVVPTLFDSTAVSAEPHYFQVIAHAVVGQWVSSPASGRSLDNIAPSAVLQLSAQRVGPDVLLNWNQNGEADLNEYAVYRHSASGVTPMPIYFLSSSADTIMTDAGAPGGALYYIVTAIDEHDNQGPPSNEASVSPVTDVGGTPKQYGLSLSSYPNPFNPRTTVSYTLPSRGLVTLAIYDGRGARVATLVNNAMRDTGVHKVEWDGRASDGVAVSSGVYFAKIEHASGTRAQKLVLLK